MPSTDDQERLGNIAMEMRRAMEADPEHSEDDRAVILLDNGSDLRTIRAVGVLGYEGPREVINVLLANMDVLVAIEGGSMSVNISDGRQPPSSNGHMNGHSKEETDD